MHDDRPQVAFVGRSNVGKSSLLNALLGQSKLARVSSWPGRTQAVNYFLVDETVWFVDLPGYGYAKASKQARAAWGTLIETYLAEHGERATAVQLVDGYVGATALDVTACAYVAPLVGHHLVVATKIDRLARGRRAGALAAVRQQLELAADHPLFAVSAETGEGLRELWPHLLVDSAPRSQRDESPASSSMADRASL